MCSFSLPLTAQSKRRERLVFVSIINDTFRIMAKTFLERFTIKVMLHLFFPKNPGLVIHNINYIIMTLLSNSPKHFTGWWYGEDHPSKLKGISFAVEHKFTGTHVWMPNTQDNKKKLIGTYRIARVQYSCKQQCRGITTKSLMISRKRSNSIL